MVMKLKSCCCGCSLRTGTQIIGWLSVIGAICAIVLGIIIAVLGAIALDKVKEQHEQTSNVYDKNTTTESLELSVYVIVGVAAFLLITGLIALVVSSMLLHGVETDRPHLMKPWIVLAIIDIVFQAIGTLVYVVIAFANGQIGVGILQLFIAPCFLSIAVYYVLVVNSYRREVILNSMSSKI